MGGKNNLYWEKKNSGSGSKNHIRSIRQGFRPTNSIALGAGRQARAPLRGPIKKKTNTGKRISSLEEKGRINGVKGSSGTHPWRLNDKKNSLEEGR